MGVQVELNTNTKNSNMDIPAEVAPAQVVKLAQEYNFAVENGGVVVRIPAPSEITIEITMLPDEKSAAVNQARRELLEIKRAVDAKEQEHVSTATRWQKCPEFEMTTMPPAF